MEPTQQNTDLFDNEIRIDDAAHQHIAGIAQWGMIVVVSAVIGYIISLVQAFTVGQTVQTSSSEGFSSIMQVSGEGIAGTVFGVVIGLLINYFLYQFATQSRKGLAANDQELLGNSFRNLKIYFIITTVIVIIVFLIALIAILAVS
ncbi:MAG TPA: hypothetical protein VFX58_03015 [Chitinophagaceae bacterium]|nr:hypothetical protein [Chitinophagaceae bacterium]